MATYFGFAIADSMFSDNAIVTRRTISPERARDIICKGVIPCLNPSHRATIDVMEAKFGIVVTIPETAPKVQLNEGDSLIVMSVRGLPRLDATRHEYTSEEIASATFSFSIYSLLSMTMMDAHIYNVEKFCEGLVEKLDLLEYAHDYVNSALKEDKIVITGMDWDYDGCDAPSGDEVIFDIKKITCLYNITNGDVEEAKKLASDIDSLYQYHDWLKEEEEVR